MNIELVQIDDAFLALDPAAPGIHRRLMAGLDSLSGRYGAPALLSIERGRSARNAGKPYSDYDVRVTLGPGEGGLRSVEGRLVVTLHVTGSGATTMTPLYEPIMELDLTVRSAVGEEVTRFVGTVPRDMPEPAYAVHTALWERDGEVTGTPTLYGWLSKMVPAFIITTALDQLVHPAVRLISRDAAAGIYLAKPSSLRPAHQP